MNLAQHARGSFDRFADRTFLTSETSELSFAATGELANRLAADLARRGAGPGTRVMTILPNTPWCVVAYVACWTLGATVVAVNPALTVRELAYQIGHSRPAIVIVDGPRLAVARDAAALAGVAIAAWYVDGGADGAPAGAFDLTALPEAPRVPLVEAPGDAAILYTSGTTGKPKGAVLGHDGILWAQAQWRDTLGLTADDVAYVGLPLFHSYGLILLLGEALVTGHRMVLRNGFEFPRFLRVVAEQRVTFLPMVPPVYQAIASLRWPDRELDLSALRLVASGAAPMSPAALDRALERLGRPQYQEAYGITETSTIITCGPLGATPAGSVGRPLPGVTLQIAGDGGAPGEVRVRTPGIMRGYLDNPEATEKALADGWYHTGDVGYLDEAGFLYLVDRLTDLILVAGENVYPREIEDVIAQFAGVARCAVVGMPFPATGEAPLAYVVPVEGAAIATADLMAHLRQNLAPTKLPKRIELVAEIPTSVSGKILRRELSRA